MRSVKWISVRPTVHDYDTILFDHWVSRYDFVIPEGVVHLSGA